MSRDDKAVPLSLALKTFLADQWGPYRAGYNTDDAALAALDHEQSGWSEFNRGRRLSMGGDAAAEAAREEGRYDRGLALVADLKSRLADGRLIATGLQPPGLERVTLPGRVWPDFSMNFRSGTIDDGSYRFVEVRIARPAGMQLADECEAWLKVQPEASKEHLRWLAEERFPGITKREFDAAYARVFGRRPGRPRNSAEKNST